MSDHAVGDDDQVFVSRCGSVSCMETVVETTTYKQHPIPQPKITIKLKNEKIVISPPKSSPSTSGNNEERTSVKMKMSINNNKYNEDFANNDNNNDDDEEVEKSGTMKMTCIKKIKLQRKSSSYSNDEESNEAKELESTLIKEVPDTAGDRMIQEAEAFDLLEAFFKSNPHLETTLSNENVSMIASASEDHLTLEDFTIKLQSFEELENDVFKGLDIFDKVGEIENKFAAEEEVCILEPNIHLGFRNPKTKSNKKPAGVKVLYDCKICEKVLMSKWELVEHESSHKKEFVCEVCSRSFRKEIHLNAHMDIHTCSKCGILGKLKLNKKCNLCQIKSLDKKSKGQFKSSRDEKSLKCRREAIRNLGKLLIKRRSFYHPKI